MNRGSTRRKLGPKTDPKIKNYNLLFHTHSATNELTRKLLKNFTKLHFSQKINFFTKIKHFFSKIKQFSSKLQVKFTKIGSWGKKKSGWNPVFGTRNLAYFILRLFLIY